MVSKSRIAKAACGKCIYFESDGSRNAANAFGVEYGTCHRNAPIAEPGIFSAIGELAIKIFSANSSFGMNSEGAGALRRSLNEMEGIFTFPSVNSYEWCGEFQPGKSRKKYAVNDFLEDLNESRESQIRVRPPS